MGKKFEDYYLILEVHILASKSVIKAAYRKLMKLNHPDNGGNSEYLSKIQEAYDVLIDDLKRKDYQKKWKENCLKYQEGFKDFLEDNIYDVSFKPLKQLVVEYMYLIKNKEYEIAYSLLSETNKKKIFKKDFIVWQKLVGELYILIDYDCIINEFENLNSTEKTVTFKVKVTELNLLVNRVEEDYFLRKIIFENSEWKILLNDLDVKNIIKKYKRIINVNKKNRKIIQKEFINSNDKFDSKSVSYNVFVSNCEYEYLRYERYARVFSIMKIEFQTEINSLQNEIYLERILEINTRKIDSYCKYSGHTYLILLPETSLKNSLYVKNKLQTILVRTENRISKFEISVYQITHEYKSIKEFVDIFTNKNL